MTSPTVVVVHPLSNDAFEVGETFGIGKRPPVLGVEPAVEGFHLGVATAPYALAIWPGVFSGLRASTTTWNLSLGVYLRPAFGMALHHQAMSKKRGS